MELSDFIQYSPKRVTLFQTLQSNLSPSAPNLKPLCPTRWTVRTKALEALVANYGVLKVALLEIHESGRDEYALKAGGYLSSMEKFSTYYGLKLAHLIFSATEQLSLTLQGCDTTIQEAVNSSNMTIQYLKRLRNEDTFDRLYKRIVEDASKDLTEEPMLPRFKRPPKRIDHGTSQAHRFESPKSYFRQQYYEALDMTSGELQNRFQQTRGMPIVAVLEKTLLNAINANEGPLTNVPEEVNLYSKFIDVEHLKIQLSMLPDLLRTYNENNRSTSIRKVTNLRTLGEIMLNIHSSQTLLCEVSHLLSITKIIPVTSATAERTFSALCHLKNFLRSTMTQPCLNSVMLLHIHKDKTDDIDLFAVAKEFISVNERRRNYLAIDNL